MSLKSVLGLDAVEVVIHVAVTAILMGWAVATNNPQDGEVFVYGLGVVSLLTFAVRRRLALRRSGAIGITTGEMAAERIAELEERVAEMEAVRVQVAELAERLDFAERLLSRPERAPEALHKGE